MLNAADWTTRLNELATEANIPGATGRGDDCVERYVGLLAEVPSVFAPGATYSYCNSGYVLLGRIIEVIDGQSWDESLHARLTGPLAATQTVTLPEEAILRRAAVGHHCYGAPVHVRGLPADQLSRVGDPVPGGVQRGVRGPDRGDHAPAAASRGRRSRVGLRSRS